MNTRTDLPKLALIAGPTASGKSALALALAERTGGVVVNADASQLYRDLRVLTARPSPADEARAPHRLFGTRDAADPASAAAWAIEAGAAIDAAHAAGRLPILVGGTGLYVRTLLDGIAPVPPIDPAVRAEVRALPVAAAHAALAALDPAAAARLPAADTTRVARALEVVRATGRPLADWQRARTGGLVARVAVHGVVLLPPRAALHARAEARFGAMLDGGAVDEVRALLGRGLDPGLPALRAIGVREIGAWLAGQTTRAAAAAAAAAATRRYVKRQTTWLRHQADEAWTIEPSFGDEQSVDYAIKLHEKLLTRYFVSFIGAVAAAPGRPGAAVPFGARGRY